MVHKTRTGLKNEDITTFKTIDGKQYVLWGIEGTKSKAERTLRNSRPPYEAKNAKVVPYMREVFSRIERRSIPPKVVLRKENAFAIYLRGV